MIDADPLVQQFFLWSLATLDLPVRRRGDRVYQVPIPEADRDALGGLEHLQFSFEPECETPGASVKPCGADSPLLDWAVDRLRRRDEVVHAAPAGQPVSVHELTAPLFRAYTVEGGRVRLGGCTLDDQPILRSTYRVRAKTTAARCRLVHAYASAAGEPVDQDLLGRLHVERLAPGDGRPPGVPEGRVRRWLEATRRPAPAIGDDEQAEWLIDTVIWCKYVRAKLLFEIGEARAELPFEGWAQLLVDGAIQPPPFRCPGTGKTSYRVLATDDHCVTVPDAIAACDESGRRVLQTELQACEATGRRVLPELLRCCPVTGQRVAQSAMVACAMCGQLVSPDGVAGARCQACRTLGPVDRDDPRIARILGEYPKLDHWAHWRFAETAAAYILVGTSFLRRLLVVLDKESLAVLRVSEASRITRAWPEIAAASWRELVG